MAYIHPYSEYTYLGYPLPVPPASLDGVTDELLLTAWVVHRLNTSGGQIPKLWTILQDRTIVQRLIQPKHLPNDRGIAQYGLDWDLKGSTHAFAIACYLFLDQRAHLVDRPWNQCGTCASMVSIGPMEMCVAEDDENVHGPVGGERRSFIGGACTNCYYKGRGAQCSLRLEYEKRQMERDQVLNSPFVQSMMETMQKETNAWFDMYGPGKEKDVFVHRKIPDRGPTEENSSDDELPPLEDGPAGSDAGLGGILEVPMYTMQLAESLLQEQETATAAARDVSPDDDDDDEEQSTAETESEFGGSAESDASSILHLAGDLSIEKMPPLSKESIGVMLRLVSAQLKDRKAPIVPESMMSKQEFNDETLWRGMLKAVGAELVVREAEKATSGGAGGSSNKGLAAADQLLLDDEQAACVLKALQTEHESRFGPFAAARRRMIMVEPAGHLEKLSLTDKELSVLLKTLQRDHESRHGPTTSTTAPSDHDEEGLVTEDMDIPMDDADDGYESVLEDDEDEDDPGDWMSNMAIHRQAAEASLKRYHDGSIKPANADPHR